MIWTVVEMDFIRANHLGHKRLGVRSEKAAMARVNPTLGPLEPDTTIELSRAVQNNAILVTAFEMEIDGYVSQAVTRKITFSFDPARARKLHPHSPLSEIELVGAPIGNIPSE